MLDLDKIMLNLQKKDTTYNYTKNMEIIKRKDKLLYDMIDNLPSQQEYALYRENENQIYNLISFIRQSTYYAVDNIKADVQKQLQNLNISNAQVAVFVGMGLGYETIEFVNNIMPSQGTRYILIIEKDPQIFKKALEATDLSDLIVNKGVTFIVGEENINNLFLRFKEYLMLENKIYYAKCLSFIYHTASIAWNKEYYLNSVKAFNEALAYSIEYYGNCPDDSLIGLTNMLENLEDIVENPGINMLYNKFRGKPAIIVSTGPSLNKNKHLLKGLEDKALIIAPDASLKVLKEIGVNPHIITTLERVDKTIEFFEGYDEKEVEDIYLAAAPVVKRGVYSAYPGPRLIVFRDFNHFRWIGMNKGILRIGKSSGNMAFTLASALGCDPIVLIGQDLAMADDGTTHAEGAIVKTNIYDDMKKMQEDAKKQNTAFMPERLLKVKGNYTDFVTTKETYYGFLKDYEVEISQYSGKCINATEGGAYIAGTEVMTFAEAIDKYIQDTVNPLNIIKKSVGELTEDRMLKDEENVLKVVQRAIGDFKQMISILSNLLEDFQPINEKLINIFATRTYNEEENASFISEQLKRLAEAYNGFRMFSAYEQVFLHIIQSYEIQFVIDTNELQGLRNKENENEINVRLAIEFGKWAIVNIKIAQLTIDELKKAEKDMLWNCDEYSIKLVG